MEPTILVATWEEGLFAVTGEGRAQEIANQAIRGLASDGRGGAVCIAGGHSLRRRSPGGEWTTIASSELELSCCVAAGDAFYVGTDDARMLRLSRDGGALVAIESFDRVAGRDTWFAGSAIVNGQRMGPPLGIRSVAANSNGSVLFANAHVGGIPRSTDGGRSWEPTIDIHSDVHEVRAHAANPGLVAAASGAGLCISRDAGATWSIEQEGLHATHCSAVAFSGDEIFFSAAMDQFAAEGRIYRRPAAAEGHIAAVEGGMPAGTEGIVDTGCIATNGSSIAVCDRAGNLCVSADFGRTWKRRRGGLPSPGGVLIC